MSFEYNHLSEHRFTADERMALVEAPWGYLPGSRIPLTFDQWWTVSTIPELRYLTEYGYDESHVKVW